jgi:hypothetical protein
MTASADGLMVFPFFGDETYTDPFDSSVWNWIGVTNDIDEVLGVTFRGVMYLPVSTIGDCKSTEDSFFWDDTNGYLYVHHTDSVLDYTFGTTERKYANLTNGYSTDYNHNTKNFYDSVYYDSRITGFTSISRTVDPLQFGLISFDKVDYRLVNQDSNFDDYTRNQAVGSPFFVHAIDFDDSTTTVLDKTNQIFQGYHEGSQNNRESLKISGVESRFFDNDPACQSAFTSTEFSSIGDVEGELKPVAFGKIRKGIAIPTNIGSLSEGSSGSVELLLADPDLGAIKAVTKVYDKDGNELTITATNLTTCIVTVTKPSGVSPDETKDYTWLGEGYDISTTVGDEYNGLNIIKFCFLYYNNYLYNTDFFDTTQWDSETLLNSEDVGLSIQTDKGWIEAILQPISASLQGVVEYKGNGQLTFWSRDIDATQTLIEYIDIMQDTDSEIKNEVVSEIVVEYSPDFKEDKSLSTLFDDDKEYVINNYNVNSRGSISPFKTLLYNLADAESVASTLMDTYKDPTQYFDIITNGLNEDLNLFDIISWNNERFFNYGTKYKAGEILEITYDYIDETTIFKVREVTYKDVDYFSIDAVGGEPLYTTNYENLEGVTTN